MDLNDTSINDEIEIEAPQDPRIVSEIRRRTMEGEQEKINQRKAKLLETIIKDITGNDSDYHLERGINNEKLENVGKGVVQRFINFISREEVLDYILNEFSRTGYDFDLIKEIYINQFQ